MQTYVAYLAGPITGCSYGEATDWRDEVIQNLDPRIEGMSPLRGKTYLEEEESIDAEYEANVLSCARGIMSRDHNDCKRADLLIVNLLGAKSVSIGTVMEIAWAFAYRIPVICVIEEDGNLHDHPMIREAISFRVTNLKQAADIANVTLLPRPHGKH